VALDFYLIIIIRSILLSAYVSHQGNQSMKGTVVG
jgi:hypothetical protein